MSTMITGATGFIGKYVVSKLIEQKQELKLFVRNPDKISFPLNSNIKIIKGDLTDKESVNNAVKGSETVMHLGALATKWEKTRKIYFDVNYNGTKNVLDACRENNVRKVVYTSTPLSPILKEQAEQSSRLPEYVKSKLQSEHLANSFIAEGLDVSVVYPTRVFGPGELNDANSATQVIDKYLRNKFPFILNGGKNIANWVYVEDTAEGIILAAQKGKFGKRYVLGGENIDDNFLFNLLDEISGKKHLRIHLPYSAALGIAYVFDITSAIIPYKPLITSKWLRALCEDNTATIENSVVELGYSVTPVKKGLTLTVDWLLKKCYYDQSLSVSTNL